MGPQSAQPTQLEGVALFQSDFVYRNRQWLKLALREAVLYRPLKSKRAPPLLKTLQEPPSILNFESIPNSHEVHQHTLPEAPLAFFLCVPGLSQAVSPEDIHM